MVRSLYASNFCYNFSMKKVLFVCSGNVCRSQIAEAYFNKFAEGNNALSAGVDPLTPHKYPKIPQTVVDIMLEDGLDLSQKKVKHVTQEMVNDAHRVVVMCDRNSCPQFLQNSEKVIYWEVEDPSNSPVENYKRVRDQIKTNVLELIGE